MRRESEEDEGTKKSENSMRTIRMIKVASESLATYLRKKYDLNYSDILYLVSLFIFMWLCLELNV